MNPRRGDTRFQACVLVSHAQKNERETDLTELDLINRTRVEPEVIRAVKKHFAE
jgi:hypothetical protein